MPEAMDLQSISDIFLEILQYREVPLGRKITLNLALTGGLVDVGIGAREVLGQQSIFVQLSDSEDIRGAEVLTSGCG